MKTKLFLMCVMAASAAYSGAAMPTEAEVEKAVPKVERMLASEKVALESGKMTRAEVAEAAMKLAANADDEAAKLLLMKGAFILHVKDGDLEKAVKTMNALETAIADMPSQVVTNIIETALAGVPKNESTRLYRLLDGRRKNDTSRDGQRDRPKLSNFLGRERRMAKQRSTLQSVRNAIDKASENTEEIDGYTWSYKVEYGTALIEAGDMFSCPVSPKPAGHLTIPQTLGGAKVGGIGFNASFQDCDELTSVTIPSSVVSVGGAFHGCNGLMAFSVDSGNRFFSAKNGMLCSDDGTTLIQGVNGNVTIPSGITSIGASAFSGLRELKSVIIPSSVKEIGWGAFDGCSGLMSIEVDEANPTYRAIDGMLLSRDGQTLIRGVNGNVTIPACVNVIGRSAFSGCRWLKSVTIPSEVTSIGEDAFSGCSGLKSVTIPPSVTNIGYSAFKDCCGLMEMIIPSSVTRIGWGAFTRCSRLELVKIPPSVRMIGTEAFSYCGQLRSIDVDDANPVYRSIDGSLFSKDGKTLIRNVKSNGVISPSVTTIGDSAFSGCSGLEAVTIPSGVRNIGCRAFKDCDRLTSVTIPSSVTSIDVQAFFNCRRLTSMKIPLSVTRIGNSAFQGTPFYENQLDGLVVLGGGVLCGYKGQCPSSIAIPSSVKVVSDGAFSKNSVLRSVKMQESVRRIGRFAFSECKGLSSIAIPLSVTNIEAFAFCNCTGLRSVKISSNVTSIGFGAFDGCSSLVSLTIPSTVTNVHAGAFGYSCRNLKSVDVVRNGIVKSVPFDDFVKTFKRDMNRPYEDGATVGGYTWSYRTQNGEATIMPSLEVRAAAGSPCAVSPNPTGDIEIPASLGGARVTCIGPNAFRGCTNLTAVSIPSGVTRIEPGAFSGCSSLMRFSVDPANPSYSARNGLLCSKDGTDLVAGVNGDVEISLGVKDIGRSAFHGRAGLRSVVMPASVTNVDISAFVDCSGLMSFEVDEENAVYCSRKGMLFSKDGATLIVGVNGEVTIPLGVTSIRRGAFMGRDRVTAITFPDGVVSIGDSAFSRCGKLESVTIPSSVTSIVANHRGSPFSECGELKSFSVDPSNPVYSSRNGLLCSKDGTILFAGVNGDVVIPMGVTKIERGAFMGCGRLTSVTIPTSVTSIGDGAFFNCGGLASVEIPPSVTKIGYSAFASCPALVHLTIPSTVTNIGGNAFCGGIKTVDVVKDGNVETVTFEEFSKLWESRRPSVAPAPSTRLMNGRRGVFLRRPGGNLDFKKIRDN